MLIQRARPRVRPQGNIVYQVNRRSRLAVAVRAVSLFGGGAGLGRELVAGVSFLRYAGAAEPGFTNDGIGTSFGTGAADNEIRTAESLDLWAVPGDLTCAWRGFVGDTGTGGGMIANGYNAASNSPFLFSHDALYFGGNLFRAGPSGYRRWERAGGSTRYVDYDATMTKTVSQGADISVAPNFYFNGVYIGAASSADGSGSGVASGGPFPLRAGFNMFSGNPWHTSNIAIIAARQWSADEHLLFHLDPYGILEEAPRYYFGGAASADVSVALTGTAATAAVGTLGVSRTTAMSGVAGTGAVGTVAPSLALALTGVAGAGSVGTVGPGASLAASGVLATAAAGSVVQSSSVLLTGAEASGLVGDVVTSGGDSAISVGGLSRTRRGARKIYMPEPQASAVFHPNALPDDLAAHAVKAWQDDEDDETWFLLA